MKWRQILRHFQKTVLYRNAFIEQEAGQTELPTYCTGQTENGTRQTNKQNTPTDKQTNKPTNPTKNTHTNYLLMNWDVGKSQLETHKI